jgi:uncharacterized protein
MAPGARAAEAIAWQPWSAAAFAQAKRENRFVIMDLEAVWCHWCHVMDETTYRDPRVIALLGARYVPVRVDQDSRPDLSNKYEDYGWPATIVFAADGSEIVRRRGYMDPAQMASMLQAIIDDPSPGSVGHLAVGRGGAGGPRARRHGRPNSGGASCPATTARPGDGAPSTSSSTPPTSSTACGPRPAATPRPPRSPATCCACRGSSSIRPGAASTSTRPPGDWVHPHFEKIMSFQADDLRIYSLAAALWPDWGYQAAAGRIAATWEDFLQSPDGSFYTSQDADLVPGEHAANTSRSLTRAAGRAASRASTRTATRGRTAGRSRPSAPIPAATGDAGAAGGRPAGRGLGRCAPLAAGRRLPARRGRRRRPVPRGHPRDGLGLPGALSGDRATRRGSPAPRPPPTSCGRTFARGAEPGFASSDTTAPRSRRRSRSLTSRSRLRGSQTSSARLGPAGRPRPCGVGAPLGVVGGERGAPRPLHGRPPAGHRGAAHEPLHVTVVGCKDDPAARAMFAAANRAPTAYRLVEWWDRREGPRPRGESIFPTSTVRPPTFAPTGHALRRFPTRRRFPGGSPRPWPCRAGNSRS